MSSKQYLEQFQKLIPRLTQESHKGDAGKIAVIGGSREYTGAPFFSAISALKVGADLAHIFCEEGAAIPIKIYSPDLIVHPYFKVSSYSPQLFEDRNREKMKIAERIDEWLSRFHAMSLGSGLSRDPFILECAREVFLRAKRNYSNLPIVIDGDGLMLIQQEPELINVACSPGKHQKEECKLGSCNLNDANLAPVILTPNAMELKRLAAAFNISIDSASTDGEDLKSLARALGPRVIIIQKGAVDRITDGYHLMTCTEEGSSRRCGGQGDLLAGACASFLGWCRGQQAEINPYLLACYAACHLVRVCNRRAYDKMGRSMLTTDMIQEIHSSFQLMFPGV